MINPVLNTLSSEPWIPYKLDTHNNSLLWCNTRNADFTKPFFEDSIRSCQRTSGNIETSLDILSNLNQKHITPAGFIFHLSRCGSTLITQLFSQLQNTLVLSEPPILDEILYHLHTNPGISCEQKEMIFIGLINLLGKANGKINNTLIIKFDSWHVEYLDFIRKVYPDTPAVFVYRSPDEVILSHLKIPGMQMVPGLIKSGILDNNTGYPFSVSSYAAEILAKIMSIILRDTKNLYLVNYSELPGLVWEKISQYFNINLTEDEITRMKERGKKDSKNSLQDFSGKRRGEDLNAITAQMPRQLALLYEELEKIRSAK